MLYKCITANTSATWQQAAHLPPTNYHLLAAQQEPYKKQKLTLNEKCLRVFWKKSQENGPSAEK